jgi:hypothetical protein
VDCADASDLSTHGGDGRGEFDEYPVGCVIGGFDYVIGNVIDNASYDEILLALRKWQYGKTMRIKRYICQLTGVGTLLFGFVLCSSVISQSINLKCFKPQVNQNRFCTYGAGIFPTTSRVSCTDVPLNSVICEEIRVSSVHPSLKDSYILVNPTGTYILMAAPPGNSKGVRIPHLVIVNYKTKAQLPFTNRHFISQAGIESLKKEFGLFLKKPEKKPFEMNAEMEGSSFVSIPLLVVFVVTSLRRCATFS